MEVINEALRGMLQSGGIEVGDLRIVTRIENISIPGIKIHGSRAEEYWHRARDMYPVTGHWPIILGDNGNLERLVEDMEFFSGTRAGILEKAADIHPDEWFMERVAADPEFFSVSCGDFPEDVIGQTNFVSPFDVLSRRPLELVTMVLLPVREPWHAPALLKYGAWNECPRPEEHCALMEYWYHRYGAEPAAMADDVVEFHVRNPPQDQSEALQLARQHFIYCCDIVYQGTENLELLAAYLLESPYWYFWWD